MMADEVSFVLTSCGRFDLLRETLTSFLKHNQYPIKRYILVEDSGDRGIFDVAKAFAPVEFEVLFNEPRLGQMRSIDRAYAKVQTPYIFHCEDDWRFTKSGFIEASLPLLKAFPAASQIWLGSPEYCAAAGVPGKKGKLEYCGDIAYHVIDPNADPNFWSITLNPGLIRLADYLELAPYAKWGHEKYISREYKDRGKYMLMLEDGGVSHLGDGRHIEDFGRPPWFIRKFLSLKTRVLRFARRIVRSVKP